jgi:hypothetical protein
MSSLQSALEALILGIPAVGMLCACSFRLDEVFTRPRGGFEVGHPLSHRAGNGQIVCIEPDGRYSVETVDARGLSLATRKKGHLPRRGGKVAVRRVSVGWVEGVSGE